jgi:RNA polymerase sigma factor (sigma-70 family)
MSACAKNRQDFALWSEFLRRITPKVRCFIRGTLRQSLGNPATSPYHAFIPGGAQENDLFQNTVLRLVENDCAAMKRFSGDKEEEVLAYLAVITRSVVRDSMRRELAYRRPSGHVAMQCLPVTSDRPSGIARAVERPAAERELLSREIKELSERAFHCSTNQHPVRDRLIFQLYYYDGLSADQIARCEGVRLSKRRVQDVLARLTERLRRSASAGVSGGIAQ